ncbi:MAG: IS66 family transposase [Candidatus Schekmanbacteria bacterium]|nr:IS66 family transposase [Candidatus Schekmanbacteria bacterium]
MLAELSPEACQAVGPRLQVVIVLLVVLSRLTRRKVQEELSWLLGVEISLGTIENVCLQAGEALADPYRQLEEHVRASAAVHIDETTWRLGLERMWVWVACTSEVTLYRLAKTRGGSVLGEILGAHFPGVIICDRYGAYRRHDKLAYCWAHLKRNFQALVEAAGPGAPIGVQLLQLTSEFFAHWHRFRRGEVDRATLLEHTAGLRTAFTSAFTAALDSGDRRARALGKNLLKNHLHPWRFLEDEGIARTNNEAERALRCLVIFHKLCYGTRGERGCRFVARAFSVIMTLQQHDDDLLEWLCQVFLAHRRGERPPALLLGSSAAAPPGELSPALGDGSAGESRAAGDTADRAGQEHPAAAQQSAPAPGGDEQGEAVGGSSPAVGLSLAPADDGLTAGEQELDPIDVTILPSGSSPAPELPARAPQPRGACHRLPFGHSCRAVATIRGGVGACQGQSFPTRRHQRLPVPNVARGGKPRTFLDAPRGSSLQGRALSAIARGSTPPAQRWPPPAAGRPRRACNPPPAPSWPAPLRARPTCRCRSPSEVGRWPAPPSSPTSLRTISIDESRRLPTYVPGTTVRCHGNPDDSTAFGRTAPDDAQSAFTGNLPPARVAPNQRPSQGPRLSGRVVGAPPWRRHRASAPQVRLAAAKRICLARPGGNHGATRNRGTPAGSAPHRPR